MLQEEDGEDEQVELDVVRNTVGTQVNRNLYLGEEEISIIISSTLTEVCPFTGLGMINTPLEKTQINKYYHTRI